MGEIIHGGKKKKFYYKAVMLLNAVRFGILTCEPLETDLLLEPASHTLAVFSTLLSFIFLLRRLPLDLHKSCPDTIV